MWKLSKTLLVSFVTKKSSVESRVASQLIKAMTNDERDRWKRNQYNSFFHFIYLFIFGYCVRNYVWKSSVINKFG